MPAPLVLASTSPRRRVLLAMLGVDVDVVAPGIDEVATAGDLDPLPATVAVAEAKACAVPDLHRPVLAADTIVVCEGRVLGKPSDRDDAEAMVRAQMGRSIEVLSAVAIRLPDASLHTRVAHSGLRVDVLDDDAIAAYLATGAADDKAGALEVQGAAKAFVHLDSGTRSNVYGLPLPETIELLDTAGVTVANRSAR